ncbi:hypothetical protein GGTG_12876 [Gaeumannomyces tritici R3-111a-1]|uniref:Uncharacterized protein n=1 Tax=Gaeumannomyces tritici (strain R3-111a-1) TaxID=644352 RepID=J3PH96_GAET3|nr:hypothetical protein GGTG_12876 [Gaeumannomyces tritici R3-111a-1]EJT69256.1 hypothetical protein GGTG_12876 [Gaeumannomyces tritici R3-111a-1]
MATWTGNFKTDAMHAGPTLMRSLQYSQALRMPQPGDCTDSQYGMNLPPRTILHPGPFNDMAWRELGLLHMESEEHTSRGTASEIHEHADDGADTLASVPGGSRLNRRRLRQGLASAAATRVAWGRRLSGRWISRRQEDRAVSKQFRWRWEFRIVYVERYPPLGFDVVNSKKCRPHRLLVAFSYFSPFDLHLRIIFWLDSFSSQQVSSFRSQIKSTYHIEIAHHQSILPPLFRTTQDR